MMPRLSFTAISVTNMIGYTVMIEGTEDGLGTGCTRKRMPDISSLMNKSMYNLRNPHYGDEFKLATPIRKGKERKEKMEGRICRSSYREEAVKRRRMRKRLNIRMPSSLRCKKQLPPFADYHQPPEPNSVFA
jgi:hypothetical protein